MHRCTAGSQVASTSAVFCPPIRQALIEYRDTEESRPLTTLVEQAVGETAGELLVHFGQAGMAGTVVF